MTKYREIKKCFFLIWWLFKKNGLNTYDFYKMFFPRFTANDIFSFGQTLERAGIIKLVNDKENKVFYFKRVED